MNPALGIAWLGLISMLSCWAIAAVAPWYYSAAPALMAAMVLSTVEHKASREYFHFGWLFCAVMGLVCRAFFLDGVTVNAAGLIVGLVPSTGVAIYVALKIWSIETGKEEGKG